VKHQGMDKAHPLTQTLDIPIPKALTKNQSRISFYLSIKFHEEKQSLVAMHLDWLFVLVMAVVRFNIAQAIKDSACAALEMASCLHQSIYTDVNIRRHCAHRQQK